MHAAPTAVLGTSAHGSIVDPLGRFTKHRAFNRSITQALMGDAETRDIGRAIANCATRLALEVPIEEEGLGEPLLRGARVCNRRLCPFCEWRRTNAWRARLIRGLSAFGVDHPKQRAVFLTLTVRNCPLRELRATVQHMHASFHRLTRVNVWPAEFWFRRTEITAQQKRYASEALRPKGSERTALSDGDRGAQLVHPHIHALLLVRPSYFGKDYVKQLRWQQEWQMAARLDYEPVVDIRTAKAHNAAVMPSAVVPIEATLEAAKYAAKATDLLALGQDLPLFHHEMRGLRLYGISKPLQRYVSAADPQGEELMDAPDSPLPCCPPSLQAVAQWFEESQEYRFTP